MATAHYSATWVSPTTRTFDTSFVGASSRTPIRHYLGGYQETYLGNYDAQYTGYYTAQYGKVWSALYTGYYTKLFVGNYIKDYAGAYTGQYEGAFGANYEKAWEKVYTAQYTGYFTGYYTDNYLGDYGAQYSKQWTNANIYETTYTGYYTGYYQQVGSPYLKVYAKLWSGSRTYAGDYAGQYDKVYVGTYSGVYDAYYAAQYLQTWVGNWTKHYYSVTDSYRQAPGTTHENYSKAWSGHRNHTWEGITYYNLNQIGYYLHSTWEKNFIGYWSGPAVSQTFWGPIAYYSIWGPTWYDYEPMPWTGTRSWFTGLTTVQYQTYYAGLIGYATYYEGLPNVGVWSGATWEGAPAPNAHSYIGTEINIEGELYPPLIFYLDISWVGYGPGQWTSSTPRGTQYQKIWTGHRASAHQWTGQYLGYYDAFYAKVWDGTRYFVGEDALQWTGSTTWVGTYNTTSQWTKAWHKTYDGTRDHSRTVQWAGSYGGTRTYSGQYGANYTKNYAVHWDHAWEGNWVGAQFYGGNTTGASFTKLYAKIWTQAWEKAWEGSYTGVYEKAYTKLWVTQYSKSWTGNRDHTFTRTRSVDYKSYWEKAYAGDYGNSFGAQYTKVWAGQYTKLYIGNYTKTYGGSYAGSNWEGPRYAGTTNYTKSYTGPVSYDAVWASVTAAANTKTGELSSEGIAKIKSQGNWKQAKEIFVKKNNAWAESKAVYVKKGNSWELVHIGWERNDITITSDTANFHLRNHLVGLGASPSTRPQMVNIYIDGADVYSSNNSNVAMDLSDGLGTINLGSNSIKHLVRIFVHPDARIIGAAGHPGSQAASERRGNNATSGGSAIKTSASIDLYVENYGIIAGGGGGGGSGGYPVNGSTLAQVGGMGGYGAGYAVISSSLTNILENNSLINGTNSAVGLGIHGGSGGLLGQRGNGAGGYDHPDGNVANPNTLNSQYDLSGNGGLPGSAIMGYDATRVSFINTGKIWGDSKYKFT